MVMTDEYVLNLPRYRRSDDAEPDYKEAWVKAQNRIEKLEASLAQSDAEPVAWRYRYPADMVEEWSFTFDKEHADERELEAGCVIEPLYAAPPCHYTSAGLIEAAEWHEQQAADFAKLISEARGKWTNARELILYDHGPAKTFHEKAAQHFRACAADRSTK